MRIQNLIILFIAIFLWGAGCASHPPVLPQVPVEGETKQLQHDEYWNLLDNNISKSDADIIDTIQIVNKLQKVNFL